MDRLFVQALLELEDVEQIKKKIRETRDEILQEIADGKITPDKQLTDYLGELNIAAGDVSEVKS